MKSTTAAKFGFLNFTTHENEDAVRLASHCNLLLQVQQKVARAAQAFVFR